MEDAFQEIKAEKTRQTLAAAIAEAFEAILAEADRRAGRITSEQLVRQAGKFIECGSALEEGGDFVCPHCVGQFLAEAINNSKE